MSLNRCEQLVCDYVETNPEERRFWTDKVQSAAAAHRDVHAAAAQLNDALWDYFEERSAVAAPFQELARREGLRRTSMRNLAEYWLRLWTEPRPRPKQSRR